MRGYWPGMVHALVHDFSWFPSLSGFWSIFPTFLWETMSWDRRTQLESQVYKIIMNYGPIIIRWWPSWCWWFLNRSLLIKSSRTYDYFNLTMFVMMQIRYQDYFVFIIVYFLMKRVKIGKRGQFPVCHVTLTKMI